MVMWGLDRIFFFVVVWPWCCHPFEVEAVAFLIILVNLCVFLVFVTLCYVIDLCSNRSKAFELALLV